MKNKFNESERIKNYRLLEDIMELGGGKILITGLGISGKSAFRRSLFDYLKSLGKNVEHYDADKFKQLRHSLDKFCLKELPGKFSDNTIYLIEDIHAPIKEEAILPIDNYDDIFYICPGLLSHNMFWFQRMFRWYEDGRYSWESNTQWKGSGKKRDPANIEGIVNTYLYDMKNRKKWLKKDLNVVSKYPHQIVNSEWTKEGPIFY